MTLSYLSARISGFGHELELINVHLTSLMRTWLSYLCIGAPRSCLLPLASGTHPATAAVPLGIRPDEQCSHRFIANVRADGVSPEIRVLLESGCCMFPHVIVSLFEAPGPGSRVRVYRCITVAH